MDEHSTAAESINPKHQALIDRLSTRRSATTISSDTARPVADFLSSFASSKLSIEQSLSESRSRADLDHIATSISSLDQFLAHNSYLLPSYELRSCLKSISDLRSSFDSASSSLLPRKKFSFRNKPQKKEEEPKNVPEISVEPSAIDKISSLSVRDGPGFRNEKDTTLVKDFRQCDVGQGEFTLSDLENCRVYLKGTVRALFFYKIRNCQVFTGPVLGSVLIEDVSDSLFVLASHQIRIHHAKATDFFLRVRSRPIIEDSNRVRFAPYRLTYEGIEEELKESGLGEETGNWANVDDFKWLRAVQSPNWSLIPEEEWLEIADISQCK
ncbi:Tubulin-folding cofactor C [Rhynchospora pubera]|uniref:Tubulin-folding cofactor C n=1 Tax=Rhynchospora pubera TaxID=906938 RepID=A0AAV8FTF6_9POAL|nr:Tubulin-folding cofactor C [Rhynchospora pubera]